MILCSSQSFRCRFSEVRARSSVGLECQPVKLEVAGSSPVGPAIRRKAIGSSAVAEEPSFFWGRTKVGE